MSPPSTALSTESFFEGVDGSSEGSFESVFSGNRRVTSSKSALQEIKEYMRRFLDRDATGKESEVLAEWRRQEREALAEGKVVWSFEIKFYPPKEVVFDYQGAVFDPEKGEGIGQDALRAWCEQLPAQVCSFSGHRYLIIHHKMDVQDDGQTTVHQVRIIHVPESA